MSVATIPTTAMRDAIRTMTQRHMRGTAIIQTYSFGSDGIGGGTASYTASGTVACNVAPIPYRWMPNEGVHQDMLQDTPYWIVTLPYAATVTPQDRLVIDSTTYEIMEMNNEQSDQVYVACKCSIIR